MFYVFLILIYSIFSSTVFGQLRSIAVLYSTPQNCTDNQFYNRIELRCQQCPNSTIPSKDRLECICSADQKLISKQLFISICESCPQGSFVSPDKLECIKCTKNETCQCSDQNILVYREQSGKIIENGALCESCSKGFRATDQGFCEKSDEECENCTSQSYSRIKLQNGDDMRSTFISKNLEIATKKCAERDMKYCELLVNLCVLQNFDSSSPINSCGILENIKRSYNPWQTFWDPVDFIDDSELDKDNVIDHQYIFDENSYIDIVFAKYDVDGTFEGYVDNSNLNLHFCGPDMFPKSAYLFGRRYSKSCQIRKELFNDIQIQRKFFEAFIRFEDETGRIKMYPIHVLNSAIRVNDQLVNTNDRNRWVLTRRFFFLDDYSMMFDNSSKIYRFAAKIELNMILQKSKDGFINPPYLSINYDDSSNEVLYSNFAVNYLKDPSDYDQRLFLLLCVFGPFSVFVSAICAYSWGRRMGIASPVDSSAIIYFLICVISIVGDIFFLLFSVIAVWITFAYKSQTYIFYNMLTKYQEERLFLFIIIALILKFLSLIFTMGSLVFQETFFIDWERQKLKQTGDQSASRDLTKSSETESVVVWRTYLIANEWNELQQYRKTSLSLQMILIIVIHEYFQYKNYALIEPSFEKYNEESSYTQSSILTRFSVVVFMYLFVAACQMLGKVIIVERMLTDPFHNFIDLCSVSNISVLSLTHRLYGYYIHGRSVHGKGDAGMSEMNAFLQRERDNLCGYRGLEPSSELQTFTLNLPIHFRENYDEICRITKQPTSGAIGHDAMTLKMNQTVEAHDKMNNFLKKFVDHSISDLDYVVRDRPLLEAVLDAEMTDTSQIGTFTRDPSEIAYSTCFVYGNEWCWTSFECLLTCVIFIWSDSIILAAFIVFITSKFLRLIFSYLSTAHLVKTSLIDQRFLV